MSANIHFEEKRVSDTVCEFKAYLATNLAFRYFTALFVISSILIEVSSWIGSIFLVFLVVSSAFLVVRSILAEVIEESILIVRDFGIQLQLRYRTGTERSKFLDKDKIEGVIVHECIRGSSVHYQLAFLMKDETKLSLSFQHLYPGLNHLTRVYAVCVEMIGDGSGGIAGGGGIAAARIPQ
jgi:GPI-GlcNAc transferase complex, PIG-H component